MSCCTVLGLACAPDASAWLRLYGGEARRPHQLRAFNNGNDRELTFPAPTATWRRVTPEPADPSGLPIGALAAHARRPG
eukprot:scaffold184_cov379-Prasinococcus_capsulatus_cf.AAC.1